MLGQSSFSSQKKTSLPREVVDASSLAVFKARMNGALGSGWQWGPDLVVGSPAHRTAGGLEFHDLYGSIQPKPFCGS